MNDTVWMGGPDRRDPAPRHQMTVEDVRQAVATGDDVIIQRAVDAYVAAGMDRFERRPFDEWFLGLSFNRRFVLPVFNAVKGTVRRVLRLL